MLEKCLTEGEKRDRAVCNISLTCYGVRVINSQEV